MQKWPEKVDFPYFFKKSEPTIINSKILHTSYTLYMYMKCLANEIIFVMKKYWDLPLEVEAVAINMIKSINFFNFFLEFLPIFCLFP